MAVLKCASCGKTEKSGKIFFQCSKCGSWWCSDHGYKGKKCPGCGNGFLQR